MILGVPIFKHIKIRLECAQISGHLKIINFPFGTNGKLIVFRTNGKLIIFKCPKTDSDWDMCLGSSWSRL